jgi:hypothetical protein
MAGLGLRKTALQTIISINYKIAATDQRVFLRANG